ncbi:tryptophan-rich sensory protein [Pararhodonellum marinum]|uniref:tryptophan-rich sensory protein n=1 Tax=Pararhodonellum marinum TaxID=2755358 RepID=UPI00188E479C|nr:tryptophan-rich sensory protein [Pararhodonellum marinum]
MRLFLLIFNTLTFGITLYLNYLYGSGAGGRKSVGEISNQFDTLITPAGYAFAIWGLIYLLLTAFIVFQWVSYFKNQSEKSLDPTFIWLGVANLLNAAWIVVWTGEQIGLSVLIIFLLLLVLLILVVRLKLEIWDAPLDIIVFVWWPICIYTGWIVVASVTNLSVWFYKQGWLMQHELIWTEVVLLVSTGIYLFLIRNRNMREAALVGAWALAAISYKHWGTEKTVAFTALIMVGILLLASGIHTYRNRATLPHSKL